MRRRSTLADLLAMHTPLARWGFTALAVLSVLTAQPGPFLVTAALAAYAWRCHRG
ncbi:MULTISPECIES: hypothetical protein [Actinomycetes]|uniref:hypothetical protein n=1 Tax=Actinomycetes TaxID=1760 RepID=UPI0033E7C20B